jgi:hypothetical protein
VTGLCLIAFFAGDHIIKAFGDDDGDGIPNWRDTKDNRVYAQTSTSVHNTPSLPKSTPINASNQPQGTSYTLKDLQDASGKTPGQMRANHPDLQSFKGWCSTQFDYISGGNMGRIWNELNPTRGGSRSQ